MTAAAPAVLLAEDEPHIVESLTFLLDRAGFAVRAEADGTAALARALENPPDVMLIDVMLPGLDGFELLRRLRADPRGAKLPVVMLTAKGQARDRETARQAGADVFISKPFSNSHLVAAVRRLARRHAP